MSEAVADEPIWRTLAGLRDAWIGLAIGLVAIGLLFHTEVEVAIQTWIDSTAYNHCFLVIPIAGYLIWDRKATLRGLTAIPLPWVALLTLPLGVVWLASERLGIMEGRQLMVISMVEVLFLGMLGWRLWFALSGPLLYLYFLVPFGEFLTPKLQDITTWFVRHGVDILHIPAYIDGYVIEIPEGSFFVAEACAGLRFLIASIAFGVLYSLLMYRSPGRRTAFIVASIIMPIIANGFRALGIVWLGHILGSAEAAATDHILYGWIFFSIVILLLIMVGLPFREDDPREQPPAPLIPNDEEAADPRAARRGLFAGIAVAVLASLGPVVVMGLSAAAAVPDIVLKAPDLSPSCETVGPPSAFPLDSPGRGVIQTVDCGGIPMTVEVEVFSPRSTAGPVNAERRHLTRPAEADDWTDTAMTSPDGGMVPPWRLIRANEPAYVAAVGLWINSEPTMPGIRMRLQMAKTSVFGGASSPVLVIVRPSVDWSHVDPRRKTALETRLILLLMSHPEIGDQVREIAKAAR